MGQSSYQIVLVEDDSDMRALLKDFLTKEGFSVLVFDSALPAMEYLSSDSQNCDLIISDIRVPGGLSGIEFARKIKAIMPEVPVILITAFGSIETAVEAMRAGAYHYIVKPFKLSDVLMFVNRAIEHRRVKDENRALRTQIRKNWTLGDQGVIGKSEAMQNVFALVGRISNSMANVLITGESGTGKESLARAIHESGLRASAPFIALNCSSLPESMMELELFGSAKGTLHSQKKGVFEEAEGGTVFLDEVGEMDLSLQAKLLRVLQERKIRIPGDGVKSVNVRVIAASPVDLKQSVQDGKFREDLFFKLSVIPIDIPPLRERAEDIPLLAQHFLKKYAALNQVSVKGFSPDAMKRLVAREWIGNVRELENVIERAVVLSAGIEITDKEILDIHMKRRFDPQMAQYGSMISDFPTLSELEKRYIRLVLDRSKGRKEKASQLLGINRRTLYRKEREYGWVEEGEDQDLEV